METELLLGIDIGTQSVKGALITPTGKIAAQATIEHSVHQPHPDWCEHDMTQNWWLNPVQVIRSLLSGEGTRAEQIKAISVSGIFPAMGPTDGTGKPLARAILYSDNRSVAEVEELNKTLGLQLSCEELVSKLLWFLRRQPELASQMKMFFDAPHYLIYKLCGEYVSDTIISGLYGAIYESPTAAWRIETCERFGIPLEILPQVKPPAFIAGTVHTKAAEVTGLAAGTPITCGLPDLVASLIGAGAVGLHETVAYYGSAGLAPVMKQDLIDAVWKPFPQSESGLRPNEGYLLDLPAYSLSVGEGARWFRDQFAPLEMAAQITGEPNAYARLHELASAISPGCDGLILLPYFQGQRSPWFDPHASGVFFGVRSDCKREALFRAILESFGFIIRHGLDTYYPEGHQITRLVATGGGARSALWRQIVSDITGIYQEYVPDASEILGDAYLAGMALGWFKDFSILKKEWVHAKEVTQPDPATQEIYERMYSLYVELHSVLKPVFEKHHRMQRVILS